MEIIAEIKQPYSSNQRTNFIVKYNHQLGYEIRENDDAIQAWGYNDAEKQQRERERLNNLSMTRGDVFEALILAKGLGKAQIRAMIEQAELDTVTKSLYLNRFDEALEFYRGYPIFNMLGKRLDITGEMLDKFFDTKDYHYLKTCKLTINATPASATVTIEPSPTPYGETAHYRVECEGYVAKEGNIEMIKDEVLEIVLDKNTTDTEQSTDVSNEMETAVEDEEVREDVKEA